MELSWSAVSGFSLLGLGIASIQKVLISCSFEVFNSAALEIVFPVIRIVRQFLFLFQFMLSAQEEQPVVLGWTACPSGKCAPGDARRGFASRLQHSKIAAF
jgi:hypothetical protein